MQNKSVFQNIDLHKSNDIMFAFDNALYSTACLVDDMNIFQGTNLAANKKKNNIQKNKNIVNKYEDQLVNEIDDLLHPSNNVDPNEMEGMAGFPIYDTPSYGIKPKSKKYNTQREVKPYNKINNNNKFIHASQYVLSNKNGSTNKVFHAKVNNTKSKRIMIKKY